MAAQLQQVDRRWAVLKTNARRVTMGYIIAWLLGVPVTLLVLFWLFFGR